MHKKLYYSFVTIMIAVVAAVVFVCVSPVHAATNLITNPGHETGDNTGWTGSVAVRTAAQECYDWPSGSNSQCIRQVGPYSYYTIQVYEGLYALHFSYTSSTSYQVIDLTSSYTTTYLDTSPDIAISDHVFGPAYADGCNDTYRLRVLLRDAGSNTIATYDTANQSATCSWQTLSHTFSGYPSGVRSIYFERSGQSQGFVQGAHGPAFDNAAVYVGDITDPTLQSTTPTDDATNAVTSADLVMTFDESVVVGTGNVSIYKETGDVLVEAIDVTSGQVTGTTTDTITINPASDLDEETAYYVHVDATAFDDENGNSFAGISDATTWNFSTGDETSPTISTYAPADNSSNITINSDLALTFSEAVTKQSGNIIIYTSEDNSVFETIDVTSSKVTGSGTNTISINPSETFATGKNYYVKIDATAFDDVNGNSFAGITDTTVWNFSTVATPSESGSVVADNNNTYSTDHVVVLDIEGTTTLGSISQMIISESPNFTGASWQSYNTEADFTLSEGDGVKAIYIKYRDTDGHESQTFVDYIIVDTVVTLKIEMFASQSFVSSVSSWKTTNTKPTFSGTAEEDAEITITINSDPISTSLAVDASGLWTWTPDVDVPVGEHTVTISVNDPAGNSSESVYLLVVEQIPAEPETPTAGSNQPQNQNQVEQTVPVTGVNLSLWFVGAVFLIFSGIGLLWYGQRCPEKIGQFIKKRI